MKIPEYRGGQGGGRPLSPYVFRDVPRIAGSYGAIGQGVTNIANSMLRIYSDRRQRGIEAQVDKYELEFQNQQNDLLHGRTDEAGNVVVEGALEINDDRVVGSASRTLSEWDEVRTRMRDSLTTREAQELWDKRTVAMRRGVMNDLEDHEHRTTTALYKAQSQATATKNAETFIANAAKAPHVAEQALVAGIEAKRREAELSGITGGDALDVFLRDYESSTRASAIANVLNDPSPRATEMASAMLAAWRDKLRPEDVGTGDGRGLEAHIREREYDNRAFEDAQQIVSELGGIGDRVTAEDKATAYSRVIEMAGGDQSYLRVLRGVVKAELDIQDDIAKDRRSEAADEAYSVIASGGRLSSVGASKLALIKQDRVAYAWLRAQEEGEKSEPDWKVWWTEWEGLSDDEKLGVDMLELMPKIGDGNLVKQAMAEHKMLRRARDRAEAEAESSRATRDTDPLTPLKRFTTFTDAQGWTVDGDPSEDSPFSYEGVAQAYREFANWIAATERDTGTKLTAEQQDQWLIQNIGRLSSVGVKRSVLGRDQDLTLIATADTEFMTPGLIYMPPTDENGHVNYTPEEAELVSNYLASAGLLKEGEEEQRIGWAFAAAAVNREMYMPDPDAEGAYRFFNMADRIGPRIERLREEARSKIMSRRRYERNPITGLHEAVPVESSDDLPADTRLLIESRFIQKVGRPPTSDEVVEIWSRWNETEESAGE